MGYYNFGEGSGLEIVETESNSEMIKEEDEAKSMNMRITVSCEIDCEPQEPHFTLLTIFIILTIMLSISTILLLICTIR